MGMSVSELLSRFSSAELAEWMAYDRIEPFGQRQSDYMMASNMAITANIHSRKGAKPYSASDFLPKIKKPMSEQELVENIKLAFGG